MQIRRDRRRHEPRAAAAVAARDADVLLAVDAEGDRESLHRRRQPRLPQYRAGLDVEGAEPAIEIAREDDPARGRNGGCHERRALLVRPHLLHRPDVERGQLADVTVRARQLEEAAARAAAVPAAFPLLDPLRADLDAALAER